VRIKRSKKQSWQNVHPYVKNWIINSLLHPMATGYYRSSTIKSAKEYEERKNATRIAINLLMDKTGYELEIKGETNG